MAYGVKIAKGDAYKRAAVKRRHIRVRKQHLRHARSVRAWS